MFKCLLAHFMQKSLPRYVLALESYDCFITSPAEDPEAMTDFMGFLVVGCKALEFKTSTMLYWGGERAEQKLV